MSENNVRELRTAKSFHENGKVKCFCVLDQNDNPVGEIVQWDESGKQMRTLSAEKCFVIRAKKRVTVENMDSKIAALEARVAELESRLHIPPKLTTQQIREKFAELILLIEPRSLQRVLVEIDDYTLAGALLDSTEQIKNAIFSACSANRKKSILSDLEHVGSVQNRTKLIYDGEGVRADSFKHIEIELVDYSTEYKEKILEKVGSLQRYGQIIIARGEYGELFI